MAKAPNTSRSHHFCSSLAESDSVQMCPEGLTFGRDKTNKQKTYFFSIDVDRTSQKRVQMKTLYIALRLKLGFDPVTHDVSAVSPLCVCGGWGGGCVYFFQTVFQ